MATGKRHLFRARAGVVCAIAAGVLSVAALAGGPVAKANQQLVRGWNNVAYMGPARPPSEALSPIHGKYESVYRWDAVNKRFDIYAPGLPGFVNSIAELRPGDTVWINVTAQAAQLPGGGASSSAAGGVLSVPASAFVPASDLAIYEKSFNELAPASTDDASKRYFATLHLPQGAVITSMTAAYETTGNGLVQLRLDYTPLGNGSAANQIFKLVEVLSSAGASPQTAQAFAHTVDNTQNVYFLVVDLIGGPAAKLKGVSIAYTGG